MDPPPLPPLPASPWSEHVAPDSRLYYYNRLTGESTWDRPAELGPAPGEFAAPTASYSYGHHSYHPPAHHAAPVHSAFPAPHVASAVVYHHTPFIGPGPPIQKTKNSQGPPGCNLFIFHVPNDMTNADLYSLFAPYGTVISARIMVDKETGRSRGFGFVSYDAPEGTAAAIAAMDGRPVGRKRLKVALKREKGGPGGGGDSWDTHSTGGGTGVTVGTVGSTSVGSVSSGVGMPSMLHSEHSATPSTSTSSGFTSSTVASRSAIDSGPISE